MSQGEGFHSKVIETRAGLMALLTTIAILIGGLVEVIPMYTVEKGEIVDTDPYTPLELAGRDLYVSNGCYNCHSQMVRPMRSDVLRYGTWSRAAEYQHDRPFQLGSRRIGPDLARVGTKWPNAWHYRHMEDPRSMSPDSIMPSYKWMLDATIHPKRVGQSMKALQRLGDGYTDEQIANVEALLREEAQVIVDDLAENDIETSWDKQIVAMIAYLQSLGIHIDAITAAEEAEAGQ